jgi:hypothetical protein
VGNGIYWSPGLPDDVEAMIAALLSLGTQDPWSSRRFNKARAAISLIFDRLAQGCEPWIVVHSNSKYHRSPPQKHPLKLVTQPLETPGWTRFAGDIVI